MAMVKLALLAAEAVAALACGGSSGGAPTTGSTIILGAPLGLTGSLTKESILTQQGYNLWQDWINERGGIVVNGVKHPVTIKYYDDTSNANLTIAMVTTSPKTAAPRRENPTPPTTRRRPQPPARPGRCRGSEPG